MTRTAPADGGWFVDRRTQPLRHGAVPSWRRRLEPLPLWMWAFTMDYLASTACATSSIALLTWSIGYLALGSSIAEHTGVSQEFRSS